VENAPKTAGIPEAMSGVLDSGRFWTMDDFEGKSGDPQSLHKYLYADCDPVNKADPSGYMTLLEVMYSTAQDNGLNVIQGYNALKTMCNVRTIVNTAASVNFWTAVGSMMFGAYFNPSSLKAGFAVVARNYAPDSDIKQASFRVFGMPKGLQFQFAVDMKGGQFRVNWTPGGALQLVGGGSGKSLDSIKVCGVPVAEAKLVWRVGSSWSPDAAHGVQGNVVAGLGVQVMIFKALNFQVKLWSKNNADDIAY
jgi:hypothetical protein